MIITYYGKEFFKIGVGDITIGYNPISKESKEKTTKFGADIGLVSMNHPDFNGAEQLSHGEKTPLVISGPGEYEAQEIFIKGYGTRTEYNKEQKMNTIYTVVFDNITLCFLGALGSPEALTTELKGSLGDVEVLFVPIGGGDVLSAQEAYKVAVSLEPNIIIPMHYEGGEKSDALKTFLKEGGNGIEPTDKLTLKKKDVVSKEGEIIPLIASS